MRRLHFISAFGALALSLALTTAATAQQRAPVATAAMNGDLDAVRTLLRQGADVNEAQADGMSALHWAAERGDLALLDVLLTAGAEFESATRIGEYRPLHIAARNGQSEVVRRLVEAGADIDQAAGGGGTSPRQEERRVGKERTAQVPPEQ